MLSYSLLLAYILGAQKNRLIETVLLSTHNICFGWEIRKLFFWYALLTRGLAGLSEGNRVISEEAYVLTISFMNIHARLHPLWIII